MQHETKVVVLLWWLIDFGFVCGKGGDASGGSTNKIAASMVLLGLVASLFF